MEYYTIYYLHNGVDAFIVQIDKQKNAYNLRPSQKITTGVDYSSRCNCYKPYRTSQYDYFPYTFVKHIGGKGKFNLQSNDNGTTKILFDIDFDEIIPFNQYDDGYYGKGYLYGDKGWYKLFTDGEYEYHDEKENNESINHRINRIITETLNRVIRESILAENRKRKVLG